VRNLLWILVIAGLSACHSTNVKHQGRPVPAEARGGDEAYWLEEWYRVVALPEDQLLLAFKTRERDFARSANPETRLRLVLLLAEGPQPVRDQKRALELLKGFDARQASDSTRALAALLKQVIEEQRWSIDRIAELNKDVEASRSRVEELELQLQELTSIEQHIQQRELPDSRTEQ